MEGQLKNEETVDSSSAAAMVEIIMGANKACVIYCAAKFNIVDHLFNNPMTADQLALLTETKPDMLYRLLRALASMDILVESEEKKFSVTKFGLALKDGIKGGVKYIALDMLGPMYIANGHLDYTIKTGKLAFDHVFGMSHYDYMKSKPELGEIFAKSMGECRELSQTFHIAAGYDFTSYKHIIDVGGGVGEFLIDILEHTPNSTATLFEMEHVIEVAKQEIAKNLNVKNRIQLVSGSFFDFIPSGGDCYIAKRVIHDWSDDQAILILKNIRKQMDNGCKLLIMEKILPDAGEDDAHRSKVMDLMILSAFSGRKRTKQEFIDLYEKASLKLNKISKIPPCEIQIMELEAV